MFSIVVAYDEHYGIGKNNTIPWKCPEDLAFFKRLTKGNVVIMGRKTYESIGKPLVDRVNIVISKTMSLDTPGVTVVRNLESCCKECAKIPNVNYYVIGGADIYTMFLKADLVSESYVTEITGVYDCDVSFPDELSSLPRRLQRIETLDNGIISKWTYLNDEEMSFLNLGKDILKSGTEKLDRTGTGTISLFGQQLEFDLTDNRFPLLTSRKMFLRGVFEELMLYIRGQTNNQILVEKGINVWTPNTTREFLDNRGLQHLPVGDMGPSYGFLFRHFGAKYIDCNTDYKGQGIDQLARVIKLIKTNPYDRRMIISLWDPTNIDKCPLPPCLYNYQFYVSDGKLSCMMTQRSSDFAIAGGWNVATGALLTIMVAAVCDLKPGKLVWNLGDVHVYKNLVDEFKKQLDRTPYKFPKLSINKKESIEQYEYSDLTLLGYKSHGPLTFTLSV